MPDCPNTESLWCKIRFNEALFTIGAVYRPPDSPISYLESIYDYISANVTDRQKTIIAGDFNLPGINWDRCEAGLVENKSCELLLDIAFNYDLKQVVNEPTGITESTRSLLDLVFVSSQLPNCEIDASEGLSDHKLVLLSISFAGAKKKHNVSIRAHDFNRADDVNIIHYLEISLNKLSDRGDVETLWRQFKRVIHPCITKFIPERTKRVAKHNPWVTRDIIQLKRKIARRRKKKLANDNVLSELSHTLKNKLSNSKLKYFSEVMPQFMKSSPLKFWCHLAPSRDKIDYLSVNDQIIAEPAEMADSFNTFFHSVFADADNASYNFGMTSVNQTPVMPELIITEQGIFSLLLD